MVHYKVKADHAAPNAQLIRAVFAELDEVQPPGLRYATFGLDDDLRFFNLVSSETERGKNPVANLPALKAFQAGIRDRCDEPPTRTLWQKSDRFESSAVSETHAAPGKTSRHASGELPKGNGLSHFASVQLSQVEFVGQPEALWVAPEERSDSLCFQAEDRYLLFDSFELACPGRGPGDVVFPRFRGHLTWN